MTTKQYGPMTREDHDALVRVVDRARRAVHAADDEAQPGVKPIIALPLEDVRYLVRGGAFCAIMTAQMFGDSNDG